MFGSNFYGSHVEMRHVIVYISKSWGLTDLTFDLEFYILLKFVFTGAEIAIGYHYWNRVVGVWIVFNGTPCMQLTWHNLDCHIDLDQLNLILGVLGSPSQEDLDCIINDKVFVFHLMNLQITWYCWVKTDSGGVLLYFIAMIYCRAIYVTQFFVCILSYIVAKLCISIWHNVLLVYCACRTPEFVMYCRREVICSLCHQRLKFRGISCIHQRIQKVDTYAIFLNVRYSTPGKAAV